MEHSEIISRVDHTLLRPDAVWEDIRTVCDEAIRFGAASVCIPPCFVKSAVNYAAGAIPICTVIGFPNGYSTTDSKKYEVQEALRNGASELDMVVNIGSIKAHEFDKVFDELITIRGACGDSVLKVIVETCLLSEEEKIVMCQLISDSGANFIKTSTGFSTGGAAIADIALFKKHKKPHLKIKASGGIRTFEEAERFINAGADRIGASALVKLLVERRA